MVRPAWWQDRIGALSTVEGGRAGGGVRAVIWTSPVLLPLYRKDRTQSQVTGFWPTRAGRDVQSAGRCAGGVAARWGGCGLDALVDCSWFLVGGGVVARSRVWFSRWVSRVGRPDEDRKEEKKTAPRKDPPHSKSRHAKTKAGEQSTAALHTKTQTPLLR